MLEETSNFARIWHTGNLALGSDRTSYLKLHDKQDCSRGACGDTIHASGTPSTSTHFKTYQNATNSIFTGSTDTNSLNQVNENGIGNKIVPLMSRH